MAVTFHSFSTAGREFWSNDGSPSVWGEIQEHLEIFLGEVCNPVIDDATIITGSGYTDGTYPNVQLERTSNTQTGGKHLEAEITIAGGGVSSVTITKKGSGFKTGDYVKIKDLSEVGGTGSGFQVQLLSANAEIGMMRGIDDRTNTTAYPMGFQIGTQRNESYDYGLFVNKTSNTTTTYVYDIYQYNNSNPTNNNGYGTWSYQNNYSASTWQNGQEDKEVYIFYCNEPGNEFFFTVDQMYNQGWGFFKAVQDPATPEKYPNPQNFSPWTGCMISGSLYHTVMTTSFYNTQFTGAYRNTTPGPNDPKCLFNNGMVYGRSYITGSWPSRMCTHAAVDYGWGHVYQDGVDTYRRVSNSFYIKMN